MKRIFLYTLCLTILFISCKGTSQSPSKVLVSSNPYYWQQHVDYKMEIDMDVNTYQYKGKQQLVYTNNSPDVLHRVFYHLYFNAFQPGSEMDVRSRTIPDPDRRVKDRISKLQPNEIGYIKVNSLKQNGTDITHKTVGTILEVTLAKPIQPGEKVSFDMLFDAQVPLQIRRSGRNNSEGVALSMAQWYPKLAEYDVDGWHTDPYIAREFYGVWGDFDVKITIDKHYTIGGTGYLQNPNEIGHGYEIGKLNVPKTDKLTWHFLAPNVHDFTWAADPDYAHDTFQVPNGPMLHFFYKNTMPQSNLDNWKKIQPKAAEFMQYYSEHIGNYPYKQYSIIQGGDGGMEYAMCTLLLGEGTYEGIAKDVISHEMAHTWFQFLLATNEAKHPWMDEGFATYVEYNAVNTIFNEGKQNPLEDVYDKYIYLAKSGREHPLTTQADRYAINAAYSLASYYKGAVFLAQLGYIMGDDALQETIKTYFKEWAFKHPNPNNFIRVAEKVSGLELDWYLTDFGQTTNTIDYGVKSVEGNTVTLERIGLMPMPIDVTITYMDDTTEDFYIPLRMMHGEKPTRATVQPNWAWAYPTYSFETNKTVKSVEIDPKNLMADINKENNKK
ncbi:M1 family metallopeptidase [Confluentibacter lentus]|uniref:M1 family metallopeptidase n=1 Tax=Confluentibacter lentus TaxID=1699412 RepID=UPI000C29316A|nr:M1 family metallopeptidase [Confluentibacter lentus]